MEKGVKRRMIEAVSEELDACDPHNSRGTHQARLRGGSQSCANKKGGGPKQSSALGNAS